VKLEILDIRSLPGIHPGFRIEDLSPGANFITGPNASGKSSSIRALRYLLTPPSAGDPPGLNLMASFQVDGQHWLVRRAGSRIDWEIDGQPAERPALPEGDALGSYLVTVEDLFRLEGDNERQLSEQLRRELNQGYDLEVLRKGHYQIQPRVGQSERRDLRHKLDELRQVEADQRAVSEEEKHLPRLREQIEEARAADHEVRRLETTLELVDAHRQVSELQTRLSGFPEDMEKLRGNEVELLDDLEETATALSESLQAQRRSHQQAQEALTESGLAEGGPEEEELDHQQHNINRLQTT
jgi:chromosome segregation ATPase